MKKKRILKQIILIIAVSIIFTSGCKIPWDSNSNNSNNNDFKVYKIMIVNDSSFEITNLHLKIMASEQKISIESIKPGISTKYYELLVHDVKTGTQIPISYYYLHGEYTQNG